MRPQNWNGRDKHSRYQVKKEPILVLHLDNTKFGGEMILKIPHGAEERFDPFVDILVLQGWSITEQYLSKSGRVKGVD